jgi:hypothetical protein
MDPIERIANALTDCAQSLRYLKPKEKKTDWIKLTVEVICYGIALYMLYGLVQSIQNINTIIPF